MVFLYITSEKTMGKTKKQLITLTDKAAEKIKAMMKRDGKEESGLRIGVLTGGCAGLSYDLRFQKEPYDNDTVIKDKGISIFVNEESAPFLKELVIDYVDTLKESGFKYKNPNASSSCGCGLSFS